MFLACSVFSAVAASPAGGDEAAGDAEDPLLHARSLDREQRWEAAVVAYLEILTSPAGDDTTTPAREALGRMLVSLRENPVALEGLGNGGMRAALEGAAAQDVVEAHMLLGEWLRSRGEAQEAFQWFLRAATGGHPPAMIQVGLMYSNGDGVEKDMEKASSWLRPANVKGSAIGKTLLAECFLYAKGLPRNPKLAVTLLEQAIEMDHPLRALDMLGTCYHQGWGVEPDAKRAAGLYRDACDGGFQNACANLGVLYMNGEGVDADPAAGVALFRQSAEQGNALGMYFYAAAYWHGLGIAEDRWEAEQWFQRSARRGNPLAIQWCLDMEWTWQGSGPQ